MPAAAAGDTIELVIAPASVPSVMRTLREDTDLRYEILADLCGVDTGLTMQVVYHLWSPLELGLAARHRRRPFPRRPARALHHVPLERRRVGRARGLRHVRHHLRGQPRPASHLHAARLPRLPAAQGLRCSPTTPRARRAQASAHMEMPHPAVGDALAARRSASSPGAGAVLGPDGAAPRASGGGPAPGGPADRRQPGDGEATA